jgi:protein-tyrosine phosphatase
MKLQAVLLLVLPIASRADLAIQSPPVAPADAAHPLLVWDVAPELRKGLPRNFRTTDQPLPSKAGPAPDATGLSELHASGSAEFTAAGLSLVLSRLRGPVTVFDLRQEDHVFVNGQPVSWYATNNWANAGKSHDAVVAEEAGRVQALVAGTRLELADDRSIKQEPGTTPPEEVTVGSVSSEADLVAAAGASYVRITVSDHARPSDAEVDRFIEAVRTMPPGGWAHFHCRAGKGRTTTFLVLYDMLRNAGRVSLKDIVDRQSVLAGDYDLLKPEGESGWKAAVFADRAAFVRAFYRYARANPGGSPMLWSDWLRSQPGAG